jgi:hypothetical protein
MQLASEAPRNHGENGMSVNTAAITAITNAQSKAARQVGSRMVRPRRVPAEETVGG